MSRLSIFPDQASPAEHGAAADLITEDLSTIQRELNKRGIGFERWTASIELAAEADEASILGSYAEDVNRVKQAHGFVTVDAIRMTPEHPERIALRNKFLSEHTHSEDEVRFFVEGRGLFNLHIKDEVLSIFALDSSSENINVHCSCLCRGSAQIHTKKGKLVSDTHVLEGRVTLLPLGPAAEAQNQTLLARRVAMESAARGTLKELEGMVKGVELLSAAEHTLHIVNISKHFCSRFCRCWRMPARSRPSWL